MHNIDARSFSARERWCRRRVGLLSLATLLTASCVSIPVYEADVFDARRTVTPATFAVPGATLEEVSIPAADPGVTLSGWWLESDGAEATVLLFGGRDFHLVHSTGYLELFAQLPVNALLVDYRGYGWSEGEPSLQALTRDARVLRRYLAQEREVSDDRLIVHGHSIGTFPALTLADGQSVGGVVLENPVTSAQDWGRSFLPWYTRLFVRLDLEESLRRFDSGARMNRVDEPVFIAAGGQDRVVPASLARSLYSEVRGEGGELIVVEGAGHNDLHRFEEYRSGYQRLVRRVEERAGERR